MYECFKVKLAIGAENNYYQCPAYAMKIKEPSSLSTPASTFFEVTKKTFAKHALKQWPSLVKQMTQL